MLMQKLNTGTTGKVFKLILLVVLFAAVAGLILTDAGGFFRGGASKMDVARVGNTKININSFAQNYRRTLQQSNINEENARQMGVPYMVLNQDITREVLLQASKRMGIRISDSYVGKMLKKDLDDLKIPGSYQEKLDLVLQRQGMAQVDFLKLLRGDFAINIAASSATTGDLTVPDGMVDAVYRADLEKRSANTVTITAADLKKLAPLDDKAVAAYYDEHKENYRTPETRDVAVLILPQKQIIKDVDIAESDIKAFYDENPAQFVNPERVQMEQIIVQDEMTAKKIIADKPTKLDSYNKDGAQFIATDWYPKTALPKDLQDAIFGVPDARTVGPVKSSLGWHVVLVKAFEKGKPIAYADVKSTIERQMKDEKLDEQITQVTDHLDKAIAEGQPLETIAQEYKVGVTKLSDLQPQNISDKVKATNLPDDIAPRIQEVTFSLNEDEVSPVIDTPNGDYLLAQVTKIVPSTVPELTTIEARVRDDASKDNRSKALSELAEDLIGKYDPQKPELFDEAVQKAGLSIQRSGAMSASQAAGTLGADTAQMLFTLSRTNNLSYVSRPDSVVLVQLKDVVASQDTPNKDEAEKMADKIKNDMAQEIQQAFIQSWRDEIGVAVNHDLMQSQFVDPKTE